MTKPKRWTWGEWRDNRYPTIDDTLDADFCDINDAFHANEPYISHLEKENEKHKTRIKELETNTPNQLEDEYICDCGRKFDLRKTKIDLLLRKFDINSALIKCGKKCDKQQETITTLREALEEIVNTKDHTFEEREGTRVYTYITYNSSFLRKIAREALTKTSEGRDE